MKKLVLLLTLLLTACGFHLRGHFIKLPIDQLAIYPDTPYTPFQKILREKIDLTGTHITLAGEKPQATLVISEQHFSEQALALARDAHVQTHLIRFHVSFSVNNAQGETWLKPQKIEVSREIDNDLNMLLGHNDERQRLEQHLRERASEQIIWQLAALKHP